jgi:hypothetical protein
MNRMLDLFRTWAISKSADYLTGKSTASAHRNRYCNLMVVLMKLPNCGGGRTNGLLITNQVALLFKASWYLTIGGVGQHLTLDFIHSTIFVLPSIGYILVSCAHGVKRCAAATNFRVFRAGEAFEETLMAQHISLFQNNSSGKDAVTANPVCRDTYFVAKKGSQKPGHNVLVNKGSWSSYSAAFPTPILSTPGNLLSFWDTGESQIAGVTAQEPAKVQLINANGHAGDYVLSINEDGTIAFTKAT